MADKYELARIFEQIAVILEMKGDNSFKVRAYRAAAHILDQLEVDLDDFVAAGGLVGTKGIGEAIGQKILEYISSGKIAYYEEIKVSVPSALVELLKIPGMGPKKAFMLHEKLGINSIGELEYACHENRLAELPGFGAKSQEKILEGIEQAKRFQGQFLLSDLWPLAEKIAAYLNSQTGIISAVVAGDIRRRLETVQGIDIVTAIDGKGDLRSIIAGMPGVQEIRAQDSEKIHAVLSGGMDLVVRSVPPEEFVVALHHYTGSEGHFNKLSTRAEKKGWEISARSLKTPLTQQVTDEQELYQALGLDYIPPEIREGMDEIDIAATGKLPVLIEEEDILGVFHAHTTYSDGSATLGKMAAAVQARGWRYVGISDHSRTAVYAHGLKIENILQQRREIDRLNAVAPGVVILSGIESDILPDGSLDYPDDVLAQFDFVIASVHSDFRQSQADMTRRIVRAMQNKYMSILGHPTGRILLARDSYAADLPTVIQAAADTGTVIEINASPYRLDLDWRWCRRAKDAGVMLAINPDAHATEELAYVRYGVTTARKGWLTAADVVNTRTAEQALAILRRKQNS